MRILIAVASRHGSTTEIARRVGDRLAEAGHRCDVLELVHDDQHDQHHDAVYDAYIVGSGIYEGHWLRQARNFVLRNASQLQHAPVFLFSSGPIGDSEHIGVDTAKLDELSRACDAVEHHLFSGRLERSELGRLERWVVDAVRAHDGDFREWSAIDAWATEIGARLSATRIA